MTTRNGGTVLVESLVARGATKSFGVPGESYLAVLDALHDTPGKLDDVLCRNEGGAAFMASAYGKLTGTPGICFVTRGPGAPGTGAVLEMVISPEALTPNQTLSQMREVALAAQKAKS